MGPMLAPWTLLSVQLLTHHILLRSTGSVTEVQIAVTVDGELQESITDVALSSESITEILDVSISGSSSSSGTSMEESYTSVSISEEEVSVCTMVSSTARSGQQQRKHECFYCGPIVKGIHRWLVDLSHKGPMIGRCWHFLTSLCSDDRKHKVSLSFNSVFESR